MVVVVVSWVLLDGQSPQPDSAALDVVSAGLEVVIKVVVGTDDWVQSPQVEDTTDGCVVVGTTSVVVVTGCGVVVAAELGQSPQV